jgi:hypothetical protein
MEVSGVMRMKVLCENVLGGHGEDAVKTLSGECGKSKLAIGRTIVR